MTASLRTFSRKKTILIMGTGIIASIALLLVSATVMARPAGQWTPNRISEELTFSEKRPIAVQFALSEDAIDVKVHVTPKLRPFVEPAPSAYDSVAAGEPITLALNLTGPIEELRPPQRRGIVYLTYRSGLNGRHKLVAMRPLWLSLKLDASRVVEPDSGLAFKVPSGLEAYTDEDSVSFFDKTTPELPSLFDVLIIDTDPALNQLPLEEALELIARDALGEDFVEIVGFHNGGIEVRVLGPLDPQFFLYDPNDDRAFQLVSRYDDFVGSPDFVSLIESLGF